MKKDKDSFFSGDTNFVMIRYFWKLWGPTEAIIVNQIHYWMRRNHANINSRPRTYIKGIQWMYRSFDEWQKELYGPSEKTIKRAMRKLSENRVIFIKNYNAKGYDKTNWYTLNFPVIYLKLVQLQKEGILPMESLLNSAKRNRKWLKHSEGHFDPTYTTDKRNLQESCVELYNILFLNNSYEGGVDAKNLLEIHGIHKASVKQRLLDKFEDTDENTLKNQSKAY